MKAWFKLNELRTERGEVLRWVYDTWYEILGLDDGKIYLVLPTAVFPIKKEWNDEVILLNILHSKNEFTSKNI